METNKEEEVKDELAKELQQRDTAEISNGIVNQVTQGISESETEVEFLIFGERRRQGIIPIEEACAKCDFWVGKFDTTSKCQDSQGRSARARGFNTLVCPHQFQ